MSETILALDLRCLVMGYYIKINWCATAECVSCKTTLPVYRRKPLLVVHGSQKAEKANLDMEAMKYDNIRLCQARLDIIYGTHHT